MGCTFSSNDHLHSVVVLQCFTVSTMHSFILASLFTVHSPTTASDLYEITANANQTLPTAAGSHQKHWSGETLGCTHCKTVTGKAMYLSLSLELWSYKTIIIFLHATNCIPPTTTWPITLTETPWVYLAVLLTDTPVPLLTCFWQNSCFSCVCHPQNVLIQLPPNESNLKNYDIVKISKSKLKYLHSSTFYSIYTNLTPQK